MRLGRMFYVVAALFAILLSAIGFAPSFIDESHRNAAASPLVIAHGIAVEAWLLLFLIQTILVATHRTTVHRRLGLAGPVLAVLLIMFGYTVLIGLANRGHDLSGDVMRSVSRRSSRFDPATMLFPLNELFSFGVFVGAGLWYRHQPEIHKRLMLLAVVPILTEPVLHLVGHLAGSWPALRGMGTTFSTIITILLLAVIVIHDRVALGHFHPVSFWGAVGLFAWQLVLGVVVFPSTAWHNVVIWLVASP